VAQEETYHVLSVDDPQVKQAFGGGGGSSSSNAGVMGKIHLLVDEWLPQQLHVQLLLSNSDKPIPEHIVLGPGQVAIVPLTFLPRFPPPNHYNELQQQQQSETKATMDTAVGISSRKLFSSSADDEGSHATSSSPTLSIWQMADREEWIGSVSLRSNRVPTTSIENHNDDLHAEEFYVATTLLVHTDKGVVQLPIEASSLRENPFGLPDVIYFNVSSTVSAGLTSTRPAASSTTTTTPQQEHANFQSSTPTAVPSFSSDISSSAIPFVSEDGIRIMDRFWHHPLPGSQQQRQRSRSNWTSSGESSKRARGKRHNLDVLASSDCFDLYLKHPQSSRYLGMEDMRVFEVLLSQPNVTFLQVLPEKDPFVPLVKSPPSQAIRQWTAITEPILPPNALTLQSDDDDSNNTSTSDESLDDEADMRRRQRRRRDAQRDGSLHIPADNRQHYLVTICTCQTGVELDRKAERYLASKAQWIDPGDEETSLGFVQIRTDKETLFVALEREVNIPGFVHHLSATSVSKKVTARIAQIGPTSTRTSSSSRFRLGSTTNTTNGNKEHDAVVDSDGPCVNGTRTASGEPCSSSDENEEQEQKQKHRKPKYLQPVLQTIPEVLEMYLLTSSSDSPVTRTSGNISIVNVGIENVTLMESSIAFHELEAGKIEKYGLQVKIVSPHDSCHVIPAFSPLCQDAFSVQVTVHWPLINELGVTSFEINGKVVVQGSIKYSTVNEWMYAVSTLDLMADAQVVVEVPLTILLVDGNIGLSVQGTSHPIPLFWHVEKPTRTEPERHNAQRQSTTASSTKDASSSSTLERVSAAFFPFSSSDVRALLQQSNGEYEGLYEMKSMDHHFRAFSSRMDIPQLMIDTVEVIPVTTSDSFSISDEPNRTTTTTSTTTTAASPAADEDAESLCSRFKVSVGPNASSNTSESTGSSKEPKSDVADLGLVHLRYMFPSKSLAGKEEHQHSSKPVDVFPTECTLRMTTTPPTGVHTTPLFVYPGQVDVSANEFSSSETELTAAAPAKGFEEEDKAIWHRSIVGFDSVLHWFQTSKGGAALRSILEAGNIRNANERDHILLGRYLNGLARHALDLDSSKLRPVLLKVGAIAPNEKEVLPLFITNHNPVPLTINIDVGEVEGMSIALGRNPIVEGESLLDSILFKQQSSQQQQQRKQQSSSNRSKRGSTGIVRGWPVEPRVPSGPRAGHPVNGLRRFLLTSDIAKSFFSRFQYRDGVWMSNGVADSNVMLKRLFAAHTFAHYHTTEIPARLTNSTANLCGVSVEHPPAYSAFKKGLSGRQMPGSVLLSTDSESVSELAVCWDKAFAQKTNESESFETILPPGGVARFDITLRSPPTSVLERDITQFLASGLVLSTSHGEVMPILILFDAPQGKLDISPFLGYYGSETSTHNGIRSIRVPVGLFEEPSPEVATTLSIPPRLSRTLDDITGVDIMPYSASIAENGVSLFMRSSFNRDIQLLKVTSCNPWFEVVLRNESSSSLVDPLLGVNIGTVSSIVSCAEPNKNLSPSLYPSFYRCAMNWVTERAELQPQGCGARASMDAPAADVDSRNGHERSDYDSAAIALNRAMHVCAWSLGTAPRGTRPSSSTQLESPARRKYDGVLAPVVVDVVANVWNIWRLSAESSLRRLSTSLRAVIKYNTTEEANNRRPKSAQAQDAESQFLSVAMKDLLVESILETPQLLDTDRVKTTLHRDDEKIPVVDFPRTYVASVSSITIPVKNPTAVPIRVRLAALPEEDEELTRTSYDLESEIGADPIARERFLKGLTAPYVQNGRRAHTNPGIVRQQWWDGSGSFFLSDFSGGLIRSHYNITVRAGSGALVSLLNPALLSNIGFLAGCGSRCGVRDDMMKNDVFYDLRRTSPIGASSATGAILMGRNRAASAEGNRLLASTMNYKMFAGGSMLSGGFGPSPFAIPFPSLGEVIIPPFGAAEVGPIYFRPPGRHSSLGCESLDNSIPHERCAESDFLGILFLENSLTGLERIALRGSTAWERVVFLDNPRPGDGDEFSDIELRNGRSALIFPGSLETANAGSAIVKEVVVKNDGDTTVVFGEAYLSDTSTRHKTSAPGQTPSSCTFGDFVLLNCSKSSEGDFAPLRLLPGQSGSLLIEHRPKCSKLTDFVALNLEYLRENDYLPPPGVDRTQRLQTASNSWRKSFRKEKEELLVGYEMTKHELSICTPWQSNTQRRWAKAGVSLPFRRVHMFSKHHDTDDAQNGAFGMLTLLAAVGLFGGASFVVADYFQLRLHAANSFRNKIRGLRKNKQQPRRNDTNWRAAFRFLARVDPTSADLQTLGREQIRMVVLTRFRSMGIMAPQCFSSSGALQRERSTSLGHAGRAASGKENGASGNEKIRTLSDAIFRRFRTKATGYGDAVLPCELGWRTAAARGMVDESSMEKLSIQLKTKALLLRRSEHSSSTGEDSIETEVEMPSIAGESVSRDSSYEEDSGDDSDDSGESAFAKQFQNRKNGHGSVMVGSSTPIMKLHSSDVHSPPDNSQYTKVAPRSSKGGRKSQNGRTARKASAMVGKHATDQNASTTPGTPNVTGSSAASLENPSTPTSATRMASKTVAANPFDSTVSGPVGEKGSMATENSWTTKRETQQSSVSSPSSLAGTRSFFKSPPLGTGSGTFNPPFRPPPGLAPPPGFNHSPLPTAMLAPGSPTALPKDVFPPLTGQSQTGPSGLGRASTIPGDQLLLASPISPMPIRSGILPPDHAPLLDFVLGVESTREHQRQNSFDVMDFLDGILNDGSKAAENDGEPGSLLAETSVASDAAAALGVDGASLVPIPSNPWAAGAAARDTASRASAYGISIEDEGGHVAADHTLIPGSDLPLLTPAAILAHAIAEDGVAEEGADKEYWGKSFYSNLLKEEQ
jgi:hypothetical protein